MTATGFLFYVLASLTALCSVAVVVTQNIVRAAAWLLFALCGAAGIFFLLGADFVGATQLLVYVGGTLVLVVFGVMLTAQGPLVSMKVGAGEWFIGLVAGMLLFSVLAVSLVTMQQPDPHDPAKGAPQLASSTTLGESLLGYTEATPDADVTGVPPSVKRVRTPMSYLLVFEIVSVHLLVVLIGAAYLARAKRRRGEVT